MIRKDDVVVDALHDGRIGTVMEIVVDLVFLRALGGGREWETRINYCRKATDAEILSARNADRNRMTRDARR